MYQKANKLSDSNRISLLSSSPRRRELIKALLNPVSISGSRGEEPRPEKCETPEKYVLRSAIAKLGKGNCAGDEGWLVSADTIVALDGEILGKPNSDEEARDMLCRLRHRRHQVVTGIAVADVVSGELCCEVETSDIYTRDYSDEDIETYIARGEPFDKAGAYAVQDDEFNPVTRVEGCYLNVVGLPLCLLIRSLECLGAKPKLRPFNQIPYHDRCSDCRLRSVLESES